MSRLPDEELISAYLDDEVTDDERAYVQRLLADDPKIRALYEELRALRSSLQKFPRQRLEPDFGNRVLARAERAMLLPSDAARQAEPEHGPVPSDKAERQWNFDRFRRPLVWSALAVAAALMVMVFTSEDPRGPQRQAVVQRSPDAESFQSRRGDRNEAIRAAPATSDLAGAEGIEKGDAATDDFRRESGSTAAKVASPTRPARAADTLREKLPSRAIVDSGRTDEIENDLAAPVFHFAEFANTEEVLIVRCDISPVGIRTQAFEKLLREQNIAWEDAPGTARLSAKPAVPVDAVAADEEKPTREEAAADGLGAGLGQQELVIVEATHRQLQATLAALQNTPETFLAVSVDPAPAVPGQQAWVKQYSRGRVTAAAAVPAEQAEAPRLKTARDVAQSEARKSAPLSADRLDRPASGKEDRDLTPNGVLRQQVAESLLIDQQQQLQLKERMTRTQAGRLGQARARKVPFPPVAQGGAGQFADQTSRLRRRATEPEADKLAERQAGLSGEALQQAVFVLQVVGAEAVPAKANENESSEPDSSSP